MLEHLVDCVLLFEGERLLFADDTPTLKDAVKAAKKEKTTRGSGPSGDIATWWQCPTCKRRIKSGAEFHYKKEPSHQK